MKKIILLPFFLLTLLTFFNCAQRQEPEISEEIKNEIRQDAAEFMGSLKKVLVNEMQTNGISAAVAVCSDTAQIMTNNYGTNKGIYIKRVSFKNRNTANYPDEFESEGLKYFESLKSSGNLDESTELFETVESEDGTSIRYLKPIFIQAPCLSCHGSIENIIPDVLVRLNNIYPDDKATGYNLDELRGAVSIKKNI
jgi:hypothetical protein